MQKRYAAGGVIVRKAEQNIEVLLIKDIYGHWIWPKGHAEEGEIPEETALREIAEETGLTELNILQLLGRQKYFYDLDGEKVEKIVDIFLVEADMDEKIAAQDGEVEEIAWFSPDAALEKIEYEGSKELLEKGLSAYGK